MSVTALTTTVQTSVVVYFLRNQKMRDPQVEKKVAPIWKAIGALQLDVSSLKKASVAGQSSSTAAPNWLQRNVYWFVPAVAALVGPLLGIYVIRSLDHSASDLDSRIDGRIEQKGFKDHHYDELVASVEQMKGAVKTLGDNVALLLGKSIKQAASLTPSQVRQQLPQLTEVLKIATREKVAVDTNTVTGLYASLSPLVRSGDSAAWEATLSLASYQSLFTQMPRNLSSQPLPESALGNHRVQYPHKVPPGDSAPKLSAPMEPVPKEIAAVLAPMGSDPNPDKKAGNPFLVLESGGIQLDGYELKNVILRDVHVVYQGGPVRLQNVTFINCQFSIENTTQGRELVAATIKASPMSFATSG